jgi:hypothetical protein
MSEQDRRGNNVRRVGPKDRKDRLETGEPLFPPEHAGVGVPPGLPPPPWLKQKQSRPPRPEPAPLYPGDPLLDERLAALAGAAPSLPLPFDDRPPDDPEQIPPLPFDGDAPAERFSPVPSVEAMSAPSLAPAPSPARPAAAPKAQPRPAPRRRRGCLYDLLALVFLALALAVIYLGVAIYREPFSSLNPLPPPTPLPIVITTTPGPTQPPTPAPTETFTPLPLDYLTQIAAPAG